MGDALELRVDGQLLARHGRLPPNYQYKKHHPVNIGLVPPIAYEAAKSVTIEMAVFSPKLSQAGVRRAPFGIFETNHSELISYLMIGRNVILPLVSAGILLAIALVGCLLIFTSRNRFNLPTQYFLFSLASAIFLVSFTEIPREYIELNLAGFLHFMLRFTYDWLFFELVLAYFSITGSIRKFRWFYIAGLSAFAITLLCERFFQVRFFGSSAFDTAYLIMQIMFPMLLLPAFIAAYEVFFRNQKNESAILKFIVGCSCVMLVSDVLVFHNVVTLSYFVKFYPAVIAIGFGWGYLRRYFSGRAAIEAERQTYAITRKAAHDIRSPVSALLAAAKLVSHNPSDAQELIRRAAERIDRIANDLLDLSKSPTTQMNLMCRAPMPPIQQMIKEILKEKRLEFAERTDIEIQEIIDESQSATLVATDLDIKRIISNLINNSVDASKGKNVIQVSVNAYRNQTHILVRDQGCGIPDNVLATLNASDETKPVTTKETGHGLGYSAAREAVRRAGGTITIRSTEGTGTLVDIKLPSRLLTI